MGASCWFYFAPYQEDLEQALQTLRQHVFTTGEYYQPEFEAYESPAQTIEEAVQRGEEMESGTHSVLDITQLVTQMPQRFTDFIALHERMYRKYRPEDLENPVSLEEQEHYYQEYGYFVGTALPFSSEDLIRHFGSEKPGRAEVEAAIDRGLVWEGIPRGIAYYAIIYQNSAPHEIVFVGASGD